MVPCGSLTLGEPQRRSDAELAQQAIQLTGEFAEPEDAADIDAVMREIKATLAEQARREAMRGAEDGEPDEAPEPPWMKG